MTQVLILAAGESMRFNKIEKQLLYVGNQTILERMVRRCIDHYNQVPVVVTHRESIMDHALEYGAMVYRPKSHTVTCDTLLSTQSLWTERNIILLGDVVYHHNTFDQIMSCQSAFCAFGNTWEIFSIVFTGDEKKYVIDSLGVARTYMRGKLRYLYRAYMGFPMDQKEKQGVPPGPNFHYVDNWTMDADTPDEYKNILKEIVDRRKLDET